MRAALTIMLVSGIPLALGVGGASWAGPERQQYVGAKECRNCHLEKYEQWISSGHAHILGKPDDPFFADVPLPAGYDKGDISYIVGGFKWKALFLDLDGKVVTSTMMGPGKNQYNWVGKKWVDFNPGEDLPYTCGPCHTTGYSEIGNQEGRQGIKGQWAFPGVQCEECHGAGARHAGSGGEILLTGRGSACRKCHGLKPEDRIPMTGVFLSPYTEYNQLAASPHGGMECRECHDPHTLVLDDPEETCRGCHREVAKSFEGSFKDRIGITCIDCHMPPAGIVAEGEPERFLGDLRSHLFQIDHHAPFPATTGDNGGTGENPGYLFVEYSCIPCHHMFESRQWATGFGANVHDLRITVNIKIMRLQRVFTLVGILVALAAFLTGLMLRGFIRGGGRQKKTLTFHRVSAWITFSIGIFLTILCLYFHFPWMDPARLLHEGIFMIHPFTGFGLLLAYFGKIWVVHRLKKGWKVQGLLMGSVLFLLWVIQSLTVAF